MPKAPDRGSARKLSSRLQSLPTERRRLSAPSRTTATPAESYPRYSSRRSPSTMTGTASLDPTYPTMPHMVLESVFPVRLRRHRLGGGGPLGPLRCTSLAKRGRPTGLDGLPGAAEGEGARGHVLRDGAARADVRAFADRDGRDERGVAADEGPGLDAGG